MCSSTSSTTPLPASQTTLSLDEKMAPVFKFEQTRNVPLIMNAIMECCRKYPEVTLQDIERRFIQKKSSIYLIAVIDKSIPGTPMLNGARKTHTLRVATGHIFLVRELKKYGLMYEEGFKNLAEAGANEIIRADYPKKWSDEQLLAYINLGSDHPLTSCKNEFKA